MNEQSTILIVDDQPGAREVLKGLLTHPGYSLAFAANGEEALARAAELTPDLILLDVMMPGLDGMEVCRQLRADPFLAEVPVLMVTALDDHTSRVRGIEAGADDFISKPFNHVELQARVRTITRLNRYRRLLLERANRQQAEEEVQRRNGELTLLNEIITAAASTLNFREILGLACEGLVQVLGLPQATAWLLNEDRTEFTDVTRFVAPGAAVEHATGDHYEPDQASGLWESVPLASLQPACISAYKTPIAIVDIPTDPQLVPLYNLMKEYGLGTLVIVPILIGEQLAGVIELERVEQCQICPHDLTLAQSISTAIGQALETAQLYQDLKHYADNLEELVVQRTRQLQLERDRIEAILEALGEAVFVTDTSGTIRYLNPAAVTLTGYDETEVKGRSWRLWQSRKNGDPESIEAEERFYEEIVRAVSAGQTWHGEVRSRRKNGMLYDALLTIAPLFDLDDPDQATGYVSVQSDITPLKEAERVRATHLEREKQAALDRLRHTFLSTVNHEMRTPLVLIFQTLELLEGPDLGELTEQQLDALMTLRRQSWILGQMVEGLTRVAAFLSKQETVRPVQAQLTPVFRELLPLTEFKARTKEITIETDIAPKLPFFPLDVKQMEEALTQLVDNAIKFNRPGGKIKISACADDDWVIVTVSDTGIGIEAEQMNRIWEIFEQGVDPVRRAQEGLGLGLVLARYIVEAHHGTIETESIPGQGSTFRVKLPRRPANDQEVTAYNMHV